MSETEKPAEAGKMVDESGKPIAQPGAEPKGQLGTHEVSRGALHRAPQDNEPHLRVRLTAPVTIGTASFAANAQLLLAGHVAQELIDAKRAELVQIEPTTVTTAQVITEGPSGSMPEHNPPPSITQPPAPTVVTEPPPSSTQPPAPTVVTKPPTAVTTAATAAARAPVPPAPVARV